MTALGPPQNHPLRAEGPILLYKVGRYAQLVGKSTGAVAVGSPSQLAATITPPTKLDAIDPSSGKLAAMVVEEINGATSVPDPAIAVAVRRA